MSDWQPIETAPKEGTRILLTANGRVTIGFWATDAVIFEGGEGPHWVEFECEDFYYSRHLIDADTPTHWMPLPEPPK